MPQGGWIISLERFNKIEISERTVIAGSRSPSPRHPESPRARSLLPPRSDRTAAAIGGAIATNASGSRSFRCGDTRRNVVGLRVAFIDGTIRSLHPRHAIDFEVPRFRAPRPQSTPQVFPSRPAWIGSIYFIGSEGTLGVITEATLHTVTLSDRSARRRLLLPESERGRARRGGSTVAAQFRASA